MARIISNNRLRMYARRLGRSTRPASSPYRRLLTPFEGRGSRFYLERLIASGGVFEIWSAIDLRRLESGDALPRVAVKRLLPELEGFNTARMTLAQEYCTLRHLTHPGVVRAFDLHKESHGLCFSMELLEGRSWFSLAHQPGPGIGSDALPLAVQLFAALAYLHGQGITHGDIKPSNILVCADRVVLTDFHVADTPALPGVSSGSLARKLRNNLNLAVQSRLHASPDCLISDHSHPPDDVFAACCSVYELLSGRHPFRRVSSLEAWGKGMEPERPPGLSFWQWAMLRQGLKFISALRPAAEELAAAFGSAVPFKGGRSFFQTLVFLRG